MGGWAGESSRWEAPAPTVGVFGDGRCGVLPLPIIRHREMARHKRRGTPRRYKDFAIGFQQRITFLSINWRDWLSRAW